MYLSNGLEGVVKVQAMHVMHVMSNGALVESGLLKLSDSHQELIDKLFNPLNPKI